MSRLLGNWQRLGRGRGIRRGTPEPGGLACQDLVELVTMYLEGALSPTEHERFEAHLKCCPGCRAYLDQMRRTIVAVGGLKGTDLDPAMRDRLLEAFRNWKTPPAR
jgi:anti-sigma factor RsiW